MATISLTYDRRYHNAKGECPIVFFVRHKKSKCSIPTGIYVEKKFVNGQINKMLKGSYPNYESINNGMYSDFLDYNQKLQELKKSSKIELMTAKEVKQHILSTPNIYKRTFSEYAHVHIEKYTGLTKVNYCRTLQLIKQFFGNRVVFFDDITVGTLRSMDELWSKTMGINAHGIHFRNIRTIFNRAIDDEIITKYPFRTFKIRVAHKSKVFLPIEYMRKLKDLTFSPCEHTLEMTRDILLLSFYFCGVNLNDLFVWNKKYKVNDSIEFIRKKIAFHEPDSIKIKIQPEASKLLKKYAGKDSHLFYFYEKYKGNYANFASYIRKRVKELGRRIEYPTFTMYYVRYSWASYADSLNIDEKVISKSLGHTDQSLAGTRYITYNWDRTDEANRKVIDYLFEE